MSYTNGIGNLQQPLNSITSTSTRPATDANNNEMNRAVSTQALVYEDQTSVSSAGGVMVRALEGSDVRAEKVAALQQAIGSGSYNVSSSDVAEKMIDSLLK
jgi:negative regulator of flagellin synthesis FlgM